MKQERREVTEPPRAKTLLLRSEKGRGTEPPMLQSKDTAAQIEDERTTTPSTPKTKKHYDFGLLEPNSSDRDSVINQTTSQKLPRFTAEESKDNKQNKGPTPTLSKPPRADQIWVKTLRRETAIRLSRELFFFLSVWPTLTLLLLSFITELNVNALI